MSPADIAQAILDKKRHVLTGHEIEMLEEILDIYEQGYSNIDELCPEDLDGHFTILQTQFAAEIGEWARERRVA